MKHFSETLLNWYDENARSLPWRGSHDPYRIWLSEIMLQQTRAEAVIRYYERFLERFPDVNALARARQDEVLKLWEGLGYYSRARNLHAAAKYVVSELGSKFPNSVEGMEKLPGVGPYAARAVTSIAWNICAPALDGNQMRVLSRCHAVERVLKTPFDLMDEAMDCISHSRPGDYNQALMDLGSAICTPKKPKCAICPLARMCQAHLLGDEERYPLRPAPVPKRDVEMTIFLIWHNGKICIQRRDEKKLLGGLYEFPSAEEKLDSAQALIHLQGMGYNNPRNFRALPPARHIFTHLIWHMQSWSVEVDSIPEGAILVDARGVRERAFPSALRKYRELALEMLDNAQF